MGTPSAKRRRQSAVVNWRLWKTKKVQKSFFSLSDQLHLWPQLLGPHVDDAGDEGLDDTELGVDADGDQHEEEHHRPDRPSGQLQHHLGELALR